MTTSTTAKVYAAVLRDIGKAKGSLEALSGELSAFNAIVRDEKDFGIFLTMPGIGRDRKKEFIRKVCSSEMSGDFVNFLLVLTDNDRIGDCIEIENELTDLMYEEKNALRVKVVSSTPLDPETRVKVTKSLSGKYGKEIILEEGVDPSLLGGIILKVGDTVIDGSLSRRLLAVKDRLQQCSIEGEAVYEN